MADRRIDLPIVAPWMLQNDLLGKPTRVEQPAGAESAGMQPRQGRIVSRKLLPNAFTPANFAKLNPIPVWRGTNSAGTEVSLSQMVASASQAVFAYAVADVRSGDTFVSTSLRAYQKVNNDTVNLVVVLNLFDISASGGLTSLITAISSSNGSIITDPGTIVAPAGRLTVNLDLYGYGLLIGITNSGGGYVPDDARALLAEYSYKTNS